MNCSIELLSIDDVDRNEWNRLTNHASMPYYINQEFEYARIMSSSHDIPLFLLIRDKTGLLVSGIVFYSSSMKLGQVLTSNGGPVLAEDSANSLQEGLNQFSRIYSKKFLNIRLAFIPPYNFLGKDSSFKAVSPAMTSIIDLSGTMQEVEKKVDRSRRVRIKKAIQSDIQVKELKTWGEWNKSYELQLFHGKTKKYPLYYGRENWRDIYDAYSETGKRITLGAFSDKDMIGTIGITNIKGRATMDVLADLPNVANVSSLLMYRAIEYSKRHSANSFNLSGLPSKKSHLNGIRSFKQSYGGDEVPIYEFCSNKIFSSLFEIMRNDSFSNLINNMATSFHLDRLLWTAKSSVSQMPIQKE